MPAPLNARNLIESTAARCPHTAIVLGGHPQGAAVALFGTPSPSVLGLLDHDAPPLAIGSTFAPKTVQYCADGDPICAPGGTDRAAHSAYKVNGMTDQAADFIVGKVGRNGRPGRSDDPVAQLAGAVQAN